MRGRTDFTTSAAASELRSLSRRLPAHDTLSESRQAAACLAFLDLLALLAMSEGKYPRNTPAKKHLASTPFLVPGDPTKLHRIDDANIVGILKGKMLSFAGMLSIRHGSFRTSGLRKC